ncbi:hypothetical protein BJ742DRAFT_739421 [Cladochytrium replicatum]|nr:hypothetical protein BJ742DRAFT_739421 [Cladochytrium replicatum]
MCTFGGQKGRIQPKCTLNIKSKLNTQKPKGNAAKVNKTDDMDVDSDSDNQSTPKLKVCISLFLEQRLKHDVSPLFPRTSEGDLDRKLVAESGNAWDSKAKMAMFYFECTTLSNVRKKIGF